MNLLITGGAGMLGSALIQHWHKKFNFVTVIDNFSTSIPESIKPTPDNVRLINGHVADFGLLLDSFELNPPDVVVHSAASYKNPDDWDEDIRTNVIGSSNLAKLLTVFRPKKVINFQTALIYGEPGLSPVTEEFCERPKSSYAITKLAGEKFLMNCGHPVISLRLASVVGPRLSIGPIPAFYKNIKKGLPSRVTTAKRDFLDLRDFLNLLDKILDSDVVQGTFNVSSGRSVPIREIYRSAMRYLRCSDSSLEKVVEPAADDVSEILLDSTKCRQVFEWWPVVDFENMMASVFSWYDKNGVDSIHSHLRDADQTKESSND